MNMNSNADMKVRTIFRSFVGLLLVFSLLGIMASHSDDLRILHITSELLNLAAVSLLFVYLSFGRFQRWLGRFYLPIALVWITVLLLVYQRVTQSYLIEIMQSSERHLAAMSSGIFFSMGDSWVIFLFLPLVLIAWQYRFRDVVVFVIGTAVLDAFLTAVIFGAEAEYVIIMVNTIISRSSAFFVVGFIVARLVVHQKKQQAELSAANDKLSNYAAVLEKFSLNVEQLATSYERNRLARELHDTLAHTLSALSVQLEATDTLWGTNPDKAHGLLRNALGTTRSGLMETRRALQALRASPLEDLGLVLAIRTLAESVAQRENFQLALEIAPHFGELNPQMEQTIYRVIQEAMENISRHAGARQVMLALAREQGRITATVTDDGVGFDPNHVDRSRNLGLLGMQERVEMLGGDLNIQSAVGKGTTIRLVMHEAAS